MGNNFTVLLRMHFLIKNRKQGVCKREFFLTHTLLMLNTCSDLILKFFKSSFKLKYFLILIENISDVVIISRFPQHCFKKKCVHFICHPRLVIHLSFWTWSQDSFLSLLRYRCVIMQLKCRTIEIVCNVTPQKSDTFPWKYELRLECSL